MKRGGGVFLRVSGAGYLKGFKRVGVEPWRGWTRGSRR